MTVPIWATSMIRNYRAMYQAKHGEEFTGSDDQVFEIFESVFDDNSTLAQDAARIEAMRKLQP